MTQDIFSSFDNRIAPRHDDYDRLSAADKSVVDRAIFGQVVRVNGTNFDFSSAEYAKYRDKGRAPNSRDAEYDINELRERYADRLNAGGRAQMQQQGQNAPQNATAMLNAINAFNGKECGCETPAAINLNNVLANFRGGRGRQ